MPALIKKLLLSGLFFSVSFAPVVALAVTNSDSREMKKAPVGFCTRAANVESVLSKRLNDLETNRGSVRTSILDNLLKRKQQVAEQVKEKRDDVKNDFSSRIAKLQKQYTTADQQAAIIVFQTSVNTALAARKTAVDSAVTMYRTTTQQLITTREDGVKAAAATFKASVLAANTKAQTDCAAGVDQAGVRATLMTSIKEANDKFKADIAALDKIRSQIETAAQTRNSAIKSANQAFKDAVKSAADTLKAALGTAPAPGPVPTEPTTSN